MSNKNIASASAMRRFGILFREFVGWALVLGGLVVFVRCFGYLNDGLVVESLVLVTMGVVLFRGGLQLVKVAVAARALRNTSPPQDPRGESTIVA